MFKRILLAYKKFIQLLLMTAELTGYGYNYRRGFDNRKTEPISDIFKNRYRIPNRLL